MSAFDAALEALPAKRRLFVQHYLDCLNATEAARRAGYAEANKQGPRLLVNVGIAEAVRLGFAAKTISRDEVLARLTAHASGSLEDFISLPASIGDDDSPYAAPLTDPNPGLWRLDLVKAKRLGKLHLVKKLKWTEHGPELELHDPQPALLALGKHYRLFVDRQEVSGPDGQAVPISVEGLQQASAELQAWREAQTAALSNTSSVAPTAPTSPTATDS